MHDRSKTISKLIESASSRASYVRAKLNINIPSQIRALRRRQDLTQTELAKATGMKQSRISAMETPGVVNFNLATLVRLASVFKVGLIVRFASYSEILDWENGFSQDDFDVTKIEEDAEFINPQVAVSAKPQVASATRATVAQAMACLAVMDAVAVQRTLHNHLIYQDSLAAGERGLVPVAEGIEAGAVVVRSQSIPTGSDASHRKLYLAYSRTDSGEENSILSNPLNSGAAQAARAVNL